MKAKALGIISVIGTSIAFSSWFALRANAAQEVDIPVHGPAATQHVVGVVYPIPVSIGEVFSRAPR